jgi:hypothetical protein
MKLTYRSGCDMGAGLTHSLKAAQPERKGSKTAWEYLH